MSTKSHKRSFRKGFHEILDEFLLVLVENDMAYSVAKRICDNLQTKLKEIQVKRFGDSTESARSVLREVLLELLQGSGE